MRRPTLTLVAAGSLALAACADPNQTEQLTAGAAGAGLGAVAAQILGADDRWTLAAATAGGIAGALYARNQQTNECAYHTGDGETVVIRDCPS